MLELKEILCLLAVTILLLITGVTVTDPVFQIIYLFVAAVVCIIAIVKAVALFIENRK